MKQTDSCMYDLLRQGKALCAQRTEQRPERMEHVGQREMTRSEK